MTYPRPRHALLACALALTAGSAIADATSQITLGNVRITLTDLDTSDGVSPWIALNYESLPYLNGGAASFTPSYDMQAYAHLGKHDTTMLSDSVQTAWSSSAASIAGSSNLLGFTSLLASGQALSGANGYGEYGALAANYSSTSFLISANTAVSISVDASISVATTVGYNSAQDRAEHANGHVLLYIDGLDDDGNSLAVDQYMELYAGFQQSADGSFIGEQSSWSGTLTLNFSNTAAHDQLANIYGEIGIGGASVLAPVPEPSSYALALGGLALLGGVLRRRRAD